MIQKFRDEMEARINRIKAHIEKMPGIFYKDLEEMKNKLSTMNNIITKIKTN